MRADTNMRVMIMDNSIHMYGFLQCLSIELATSIKDALIEEMPEMKEEFEKNFELLNDDLVELDNKFKEMASNAPSKTFFVSHAAFGYIADTYGLEQVAIAGLNSQSEPPKNNWLRLSHKQKNKM